MVAGSVLYLASLAIANVLSIAITIFITYKIVKVSNGYSLFDPDASFGIKIRKYYMISIALSCFLRFIGTVVEFSVVALVALTYDSKDLDSWLMLHQDNFLLVVWISRTVPSISFIMTFAILVYYLASLRASLYGIESNSLWYWTISIHSLVLIGTIILLIFSEMTPLSSLLLAFYVIYFSLTVWFSVKIVRYFSSSGMPLPSRRIIERFSILVILSLMTMFFGGVYRVFQIEIIVTPRIFWIYSATELAVIILLELLPSLAIVALVSNNITTMEQYLATGQRSNLRTNIRQNTGKANYSSIEENTKLLIQPRG